QKRLQPVQPTDKLIADLGHEKFLVRDKATNDLRELGQAAEPALRAALTRNLPLEARRRIEQLLQPFADGKLSGEQLRTLRSVAVLEQIGNRPARDLLQHLATGAPEARLSQAAQAASMRLEKRSVGK